MSSSRMRAACGRSIVYGGLLLAACGNGADDSDGGANTPPLAGSMAAPPAGGSGNASGAGGGAAATIPKAGQTAPAQAGMSGGAGQAQAGGTAGAGAESGGMGGSTEPGPQAGTDAPGPETGTFPAVTDLVGDGPFADTSIPNTGPSNNYTIYLPEQLAPSGVKNPIVVWMSGGSTDPTWYPLLPHLATHGFVVVASNTVPAIGEEIALGQDMKTGLDWILAEVARDGSMFAGKLDEAKVCAMGYSMGGLATTTIADDPRLTTTVHISGGNMEVARIAKLHAPAAFLCGESDIANPNCETDFAAATTPVFYGVFMGGDHLGILLPPYQERIGGAVTGWLRWQLMDDRSRKSMFVGDACTLCTDTANWTVHQKNLQ